MKSPKIIGSNKKMMVLKWQDFEVSKNTPFLEIRANVTCFAKFYWVGLNTIYGIKLIMVRWKGIIWSWSVVYDLKDFIIFMPLYQNK